MPNQIDLTKCKNALPHASEMFGVYYEITNSFYTANGKQAERTWNFSNDKYWE
jgi:hypothetical protein